MNIPLIQSVSSDEQRSPRPSLCFGIQTVDPSAFEMPDAPANEAGVFLFSREVRRKSCLWHKADIPEPPINVRFRRQSRHRD